jgi:hypothetical protein
MKKKSSIKSENGAWIYAVPIFIQNKIKAESKLTGVKIIMLFANLETEYPIEEPFIKNTDGKWYFKLPALVQKNIENGNAHGCKISFHYENKVDEIQIQDLIRKNS